MPKVIRFQSSYVEPYPLQVQGESGYRKELAEISGHTGEEEGVYADDFIAQLLLEDDNLDDPKNAVRVEIDGKPVGYLSKSAAKRYRKRLIQLGLFDTTGECYASIRGGFVRDDGGQADFGVRLDLDLDTFNDVMAKPQPKASPMVSVSNGPTTVSTQIPSKSSQPPAQSDGPVFVSGIPRPRDGGTVHVSNTVPNPKPAWRKTLDWFFGPSKNRIWRVILFFFLALLLCGIAEGFIRLITGIG